MIDQPTYAPFNECGYFAVKPVSHYAVGLDLGTVNDYTAMSAVEYFRAPIPVGAPNWMDCELRQRLSAPQYRVRDLRRFKLGLSYVAIAHEVLKLMIGPLRGAPLIVDSTGVGRPVCDLLEECGLKNMLRVLITSGHAESRGDRDEWQTRHIPKQLLISNLQAAFHLGELRIAPQLAEAKTLGKELTDFRASRTEAGNLSLNARSGQHDDLVLSVALAAYHLRRPPRNRWSVQQISL